jgi:hypothetical protein
LLGQKTMEVEILKESLDAAQARSNLIQWQNRPIAPRGRYRKVEDADLLPLIRASVDERPTYGYRRVCALTNRRLRIGGNPTVKLKRVLRIMQIGSDGRPLQAAFGELGEASHRLAHAA